MAENQRWRLIGAASALLAERRLTGLTSRAIACHAGVSSHTFYEHFESVDDVLGAAFANAAEVLVELVGTARSVSDGDGGACEQAISSAVSLGRREPGLAALMRTELAVGVEAVRIERERLLTRIDHSGRALDREGPSRIAAASALALAVERLDRGDSDGLGLGGEFALMRS